LGQRHIGDASFEFTDFEDADPGSGRIERHRDAWPIGARGLLAMLGKDLTELGKECCVGKVLVPLVMVPIWGVFFLEVISLQYTL
jgi:hypothetical protein